MLKIFLLPIVFFNPLEYPQAHIELYFTKRYGCLLDFISSSYQYNFEKKVQHFLILN